jgi:hypothetical protein
MRNQFAWSNENCFIIIYSLGIYSSLLKKKKNHQYFPRIIDDRTVYIGDFA